MKTTYHSKTGKFCCADSAHTVVKSGARFKVVRQHRRVGVPQPKVYEADLLPSSKWVPLSEVLASAFGARRV